MRTPWLSGMGLGLVTGAGTSYARIDSPLATGEVRMPILRPSADTCFRIVTPAP